MIGIIDYNMGNLGSAVKAFEVMGGNVRLLKSGEELESCDKIVLPGVGNFGEGMMNLSLLGFTDAIRKFVASGKPMLGICLGMQMMLSKSEEAPDVEGLGLLEGVVRRFPDGKEKIPHMGWNDVKRVHPTPLYKASDEEEYFYFVHSYYAEVTNKDEMLGVTEYIKPFASVIGRDNILGFQFHPEKSQTAGLKLIKNFIDNNQ